MVVAAQAHMLDTEIRRSLRSPCPIEMEEARDGGARVVFVRWRGQDRGECVRTHPSGKLRSPPPPPAPYFPRDQGKYKFKQLRPFQTRSTTANTVRRVNFVPFRIIGIPARTNKR